MGHLINIKYTLVWFPPSYVVAALSQGVMTLITIFNYILNIIRRKIGKIFMTFLVIK